MIFIDKEKETLGYGGILSLFLGNLVVLKYTFKYNECIF